jgi:hypothetical protein
MFTVDGLEDVMELTKEEQYVVFAALTSMVDDIHTVQDQMTPEQWDLAKKLHVKLTKIVDEHE